MKKPGNGPLLVGLGIVHIIVGAIVDGEHLLGIAQDGFINAIASYSSPRMGIFWFTVTGVALMILGQLWTWAERQGEHPVPPKFAWELVAVGVIGAAIIPVSGFWLLIALGLYFIARAQPRSRAEVESAIVR